MAEKESIPMYSDKLPDDVNFGIETDLSSIPAHKAEDFVNG